jgi:hypothetical protein
MFFQKMINDIAQFTVHYIQNKKVPKKSARFNSSYHNKPITRVIKAKPTWVSLSNPQPRPWNQNNFIKKENEEKHLC